MAVDVAHRTVSEILARTLDGERLSDDDAVTLLRSRDLVSVGTAADELRGRRRRTRTRSRSSSTGTSTTRTSA